MFKLSRSILALTALLVLLSSASLAADAAFKVYGHRGMVNHYPENTMAAFQACVDAGVSIELDVYLTKDGVPVVIHDATVDRTTNGHGAVANMTLSEIKALDAGSWYDPKFKSEKVPTFGEVFDMISSRDTDKDTFVAINMKLLSPKIEEKIVRIVERFDMLDRVFSFGMDAPSMERFKIANPLFPIARSGDSKYHYDSALRTTYLDYIWISPQQSYMPSAQDIATAHAGRQNVLVYIRANEPDRWEAAKAAGADAICTDHPLLAKKALGL
ncbi:MAG: glycerophosphodiester phosphodiesterase family protein [Acidobacteria bacterium]|nr:glycerophosphodiester phosphodiesterase family protein [Acidobacteriota bacterium]